MRFQGKITNWNDAKGIGTIVWNGSTDRVFVHISAFTSRGRRPVDGDVVVYEAEKGTDGKFRAVKVSFASQQRERPASAPPSGVWLNIVALLFVIYLLAATWVGRDHFLLASYYGVASFVTFIAYWWDKGAAKLGRWRTQESSLHLMALLGGWPGALMAQRVFRHKTVKQPFQGVFLATIAINLVGFVWAVTSPKFNVMLAGLWGTFVH